MNTYRLILLAFLYTALSSCDNDDDNIVTDNEFVIENPATYTFERDGMSTVSFSGQTTRIQMAEEIISALKDNSRTEAELLSMFNHMENDADFADADLNSSDKNVSSKTAASFDYFNSNATEASTIVAEFEDYIQDQVNEVFPAWNNLAAAGVPGQIADGSSTRYVNAQGLEYNQAFNKHLIGALMVDQALNNYLSPGVLDEADNIANNDMGIPATDKPYTTMEHKWDEAYGYLYGTAADLSNPNATIGQDDNFLNKYLGRVEGDTDFAGIADDIYQAFKLGRAAIVAGDYDTRDEQADIIQNRISEVIAIRAVYYLQQGKLAIQNGDMGPAFHDLSEGYGFIKSLRFTRNTTTGNTYFTGQQVDDLINDLMGDGANGFWDVTPATLDALSETIAQPFAFTVAQAAN